jgi:acetyltransferase-like isoleucine patch superfamily enzyme
MESKIYDNVQLGEGCVLHHPVILGQPPRGAAPGERPLVIGPGAVIRPFTTIYAGTVIGARFQSGQGASIREDNVIGDDCSVGTNAVLEYGNRIGNGTRIHSGCFLEWVTLGNHVFLAPNVVFTDDPHPMCPRYQDCKGGAVVEDLVKVGANATILPGVRLGRNCLIGAGAVVASDIPPDMVAAGSPARVVKRLDELTCWPGHFERPYVWEPYGPLSLPRK